MTVVQGWQAEARVLRRTKGFKISKTKSETGRALRRTFASAMPVIMTHFIEFFVHFGNGP